MEEPCDVPDLLDIFTKIVCDRKDYCFLCLRTSDERRLVKPDNFKKFMAAIKQTTNANMHYICHICERQASNALKLFRATVFASSLSLILDELCKRDIQSNKVMFETKYFTRVLNKVQLSKNLTPAAINDEVRLIRNNNLLSETDTLVMDNRQVYEAAPTMLAITADQDDSQSSQAIQQAIIQCPVEPIVQHIQQRCSTPSILPDREASPDEIGQNSYPEETYVLLDDEDDPLRTTNYTPSHTPINYTPINHTPINHTLSPSLTNDILSATANASVNQNLMSTVSNLNDNLVITTDPPNIVRFEDLLTQHSKQTNFLLHPIFLAEDGTLNVPSLSATIIKSTIYFQDNTQQIRYSKPLHVNMEVVKQSLKLKREVFIQNCNTFQLPSGNSNLVNLLVDKGSQKDYPSKKKKLSNSVVRSSGYSKSDNSRVKEVTVSDVSSGLNERRKKGGDAKTDWEDKIPMDVISFVDAVDPNADSVLKDALTNPCNSMQVGNVRSLARQETADSDVIDLC